MSKEIIEQIKDEWLSDKNGYEDSMVIFISKEGLVDSELNELMELAFNKALEIAAESADLKYKRCCDCDCDENDIYYCRDAQSVVNKQSILKHKIK